MAQLNFVDSFLADLAAGVHDFSADTFMVALTTDANAVARDDDNLADLTQIAYTNLSSRALTISAQGTVTTNDWRAAIANLTLTASGGDVATFRHVAVYNDTASGDPLIAFLDLGQDVTILDGNSATIRFNDPAGGALQLATSTPA